MMLEMNNWFFLFCLAGANLQKIIDDGGTEIDSNSSDFWVMVAALKVTCFFLENTNRKKGGK